MPRSLLGQIDSLFGAGTAVGLGDGPLLERFVRRADEAAFAALVARHGPMVLGVCRRVLRDPHDAEDAFQATFLVLARKARSIARPEALGPWLHGVARHAALQARERSARRGLKEREAAAMARSASPPGPGDRDPAAELRHALDDELGRLPEPLRAAVILCELEGRPRKEAAQMLGLPEGTLSSRLARARGLLRERLARRGLGAGVAGLAALLSEDAAASAIPEALETTLLKAAMRFAAGSTPAGAPSAPAVILAEGVIKTMLAAKLKLPVAALSLGLVLASGTLAQDPGPNPLPQALPPTAARDDARLDQMEKKLDRLLEAVGGGDPGPPTLQPIPMVTSVPAPRAGGAVDPAPRRGVRAPGTFSGAPEKAPADRLRGVELRLDELERRVGALSERLDRLEGPRGTPRNNLQRQ